MGKQPLSEVLITSRSRGGKWVKSGALQLEGTVSAKKTTQLRTTRLESKSGEGHRKEWKAQQSQTTGKPTWGTARAEGCQARG